MTQRILKEVERVHPARAVIDALSEIRLLAGDALRYRRQILALKQYFANRNCTILLLDDRTLELTIFSSKALLMELFSRCFVANPMDTGDDQPVIEENVGTK